MALPQRKRMRLKGYDYSNAGCYFVTICTHNKKKLFGDVERLNSIGAIIDEEINNIPTYYDDVKIDKYIIMPDHVHILLKIGCDALPNDDDVIINEVLNKTEHHKLDRIVGLFKAGATRRIHQFEPDIVVWQRSFYDHIVTNKNEYNEIWNYIDTNPIRWEIKHGIDSMNI